MSELSVSSETKPDAKPRRRRPNDRSEVPVSFLPEGNPPAKWAYIFLIAGLVPGVGIVTGWLAMILGCWGYRRSKRDELKRGLGHSCVSIVLGLIEVISNGFGWWLLLDH